MANTFTTNVFRTQENVNKDNMNYTVVDKDQKLSAYFPMPSQNLPSGITPGVICNGIGTINNLFGFNSTSNQFNLTAGIIRFPDAISNNSPYNVSNQTASISQFLALDAPTPQPALTTPLVPNTYYLVATLNVIGSGSAYQYTNNSPNPPTPPYTIIATSAFTPITSLTQVALCLITIVGTNVQISTDINCAVNYGTIQYKSSPVLLQQGRLNGIGSANSPTAPYDDTQPTGSSTLYFTPTEQGNLISLYNGSNWVTQPFSELSLSVASLVDLPNVVVGTLSPIDSIFAGNGPQGVVVSPDGLNVYVASNYDNRVSQFSRNIIALDPNFGKLTSIGNVSTGRLPQALTISSDGLNVYVTNFNDNSISQYSRASGGLLTSIGAVGSTENNPAGIVISPNLAGQSSNVYVANSGNATITQYTRNGSGLSGTLTSLGTIGAGSGTIVIIVSSDGLNVYATNLKDNTVSQYSRDSGTGQLTSIGTAIGTGTRPQGITISPDGLNVYVANNGNNTVSQYSRASGGLLTSIGTTSVTTGSNPQEIIISPDNLNVYVTNFDGSVSQYSRASGGLLTSIGTIGAGGAPSGINISPLGENVYVTNFTGNNLSEYSRYSTPPPPPNPTVSLTRPNSTTNVVTSTDVVLTFSEQVAGVSTTTVLFTAQGSTTQIATGVVGTVGNTVWTLTFTKPLSNATTYTVAVVPGITSVLTGYAVLPITFPTFTTVGTDIPPTVALYEPSPATNVPTNSPIQLQFNETVLGVTPTSTASATGTIQFAIVGQPPQPITITQSANNTYTLNGYTPLTGATQYVVIVNAGITDTLLEDLPPTVLYFTTTYPQPPTPTPPGSSYDVYVANISGVLTLVKDTFSTSTVNNRTQQDGRWVNANLITTATGQVQPSQGLLVGSIKVDNTAGNNGNIKSWTAYRGIWNLYNQVRKSLFAEINGTWLIGAGLNKLKVMNGNSIPGQGNFSFLLDKLYFRDFIFNYNSLHYPSPLTGVQIGYDTINYLASFLINQNTAVTVQASNTMLYSVFNISASGVFNLVQGCQVNFNAVVPNTSAGLVYGINLIQKTENSTYVTPNPLLVNAYITNTEETNGLVTEFWG